MSILYNNRRITATRGDNPAFANSAFNWAELLGNMFLIKLPNKIRITINNKSRRKIKKLFFGLCFIKPKLFKNKEFLTLLNLTIVYPHVAAEAAASDVE